MRWLTKLLGICALSLTLPTLANATTYYVGNGGTATTCAQSQNSATPWPTLVAALNGSCLAPGDTLHIKAGTYTGANNRMYEPTVTVPNGSAAGGYITFEGEGIGVTILRPNMGHNIECGQYLKFTNLTFDGITDTSVGSALRIANSGCTVSDFILFEDMEAMNAQDNGLSCKCDHTTIRRSRFHHNGTVGDTVGRHGIYFSTGSNNTLVEYSEFDHNGNAQDQLDSGVQWNNGTSAATNITFRYNYVHDNTAGGIFPDTRDSVFHSNFFINNGNWAIELWGGNDLNNNKIYNNVISGHTESIQVGIWGTASGTLITNNIIVSTTTVACYNQGTSISCASNGTVLTTNKQSGVLTDYVVSTTQPILKTGSTAIETGTAITGFPYNGTTRDIAATESFTATGGTVSGNTMDVQLGMNLSTPLRIGNGLGWSVNNGRTVTNVALVGSSIARLTFDGAVCTGAQTWTVSYNDAVGTASDSVLIGNTINQTLLSFGPVTVTNNCAGAGYTITQTAGAIYSALGSQETNDTTLSVHPGGQIAIRTKVKFETADPPPLATKLQYSTTGENGTYADVPDTYGAAHIRYVGFNGATHMATHGTPLVAERLTSGFAGIVAGAVVLCSVGCEIPTIDPTQNSESEQVDIVEFESTAVAGTVYWFRRVLQDGSTINYGVQSKPSITVLAHGATGE